MKTILILLLAIITLAASAQTGRIRGLTTETTYNGTLSIPCDRSTYSVHHKIFLSTITDYINGLALTRDTAIWERLTSLEADTVWTAGGGTSSIMAVNSQDTAYGNYSLAHGYQSRAYAQGMRAYSSGALATYGTAGWGQAFEFTATIEAKAAATDTLLIGGIDVIPIPNNHSILATVTVHGVAYNGVDAGLTYNGTYQFCIKQIAGTTTITAIDTLAETIEAGITATFTAVADDANERLILQVVGTDGGDMYWYAEVKGIIIKFG